MFNIGVEKKRKNIYTARQNTIPHTLPHKHKNRVSIIGSTLKVFSK
jgi:hypothetical protein